MKKKPLLPKSWEVPQIIRDRLGNRPGRQRAMLEEGHLLLILHAPPKPDEDTREGRYFWREPDGTWHTNLHGSGIAALQQHLKEFREAIEKQEEAEERASGAEDYFRVLRELTPLKRTARNLYNTLQQAREMVPAEQSLITSRDEAYVLDREADLLHGDAMNGLNYFMAKQAEQQANQSLHIAQAGNRLNALAAIFLPLATIASLLGMNVKHGFEDFPPPLLFIVVLAGGLSLGLILKSTFFGKNPESGEE